MPLQIVTPLFQGNTKEPTIEIILRWKEEPVILGRIFHVQHKTNEVTIYNKQEYEALIKGIQFAINNITLGRS